MKKEVANNDNKDVFQLNHQTNKQNTHSYTLSHTLSLTLSRMNVVFTCSLKNVLRFETGTHFIQYSPNWFIITDYWFIITDFISNIFSEQGKINTI